MFSRSYIPEYTKEQKETFMQVVDVYVKKIGVYLCQNKYPYDLYKGKKVKTDHRISFVNSGDEKELVTGHMRALQKMGYVTQENKKEDQIIPGIDHIHFIKIID